MSQSKGSSGARAPPLSLKDEKAAEVRQQGPRVVGGALSLLPCALPGTNEGIPGQSERAGPLHPTQGLPGILCRK